MRWTNAVAVLAAVAIAGHAQFGDDAKRLQHMLPCSATVTVSCIPVVNASGATVGGPSSAVTALQQANLVAEYPLAEGQGAYAYNYAYTPQPIFNLVGPSEENFSAGSSVWATVGTTLTDAYAADPNGDWVASRLQATSTGGYLATPPTPGPTLYVGSTYTLSIYVASNTGSAQTIRMTDNQVNYSSNMTVPATGWTRLAFTWTAAYTGGYVIPVAQDAAGDNLDILIWGVQLELGSHPTTYVPQVYQMVNGGGPQRTGAQCAWIAAGIDCTGNSGASYMEGIGWQPIDLSTLTVYAAVKWTGTAVLSGYAPILNDNYANQKMYLSGMDVGVPFPRLRFSGVVPDYAYAANLNDGNWHILVGEYDGANFTMYLDGLQVAAYAVGSTPPVQVQEMFLGNQSNAAYWPGQMGYVALYSVPHPIAQVVANTAAIRAIMAARGVTIPALSQLLVFEGDSITDPTTGVVAASKYYHVAQSAITPFPQGANDAVSGSSIATAITREATVDSWFAPVTGLKVLFLFLGANDMGEGASGFVASVKSYCLARKAASPGLKIVLATVLPQTTTGFNAFRDAVNPLIHADPSFYDAIADFAADPTMGCDSCAANTTYFSDGEHPTIAGHAILGPIAAAAIQSVGIL